MKERYERVRRWYDACISHPAAQQVTKEEIVKVYYDYAKGSMRGVLGVLAAAPALDDFFSDIGNDHFGNDHYREDREEHQRHALPLEEVHRCVDRHTDAAGAHQP